MNQSNQLLSDIVSYRSYAKYIAHLARRESLEETIGRTESMHLDKFPSLSQEISQVFNSVRELKIMPSMRSLQFAGEAILKNNIRSYNCSFAAIDDVAVFGEILFILLSGTGVGFSVQKDNINRLPKIKLPRQEGSFIVQDSIAGWAQALDILMRAYFYNQVRPNFDYSAISVKGTYLVTTGAKAPGPEALKIMLAEVELRLKAGVGRKLSSLEIHDIICVISDCVLSGGIRRSALISLFDKDDNDMLTSKSGDWWVKHPYRARANNSALLLRETTTKEEFDNIFDACRKSNAGEPGISLTNSLKLGTNPCVTGDTEILTRKGNLRIDLLVGSEVEIWNGFEWSTVTPKVTGKNQPLIEVKTLYGKTLVCTTAHKFYLEGPYKGELIQVTAENLKIGDHLMSWKSPDGADVFDSVVGLSPAGVAETVYCFNEPKRHLGVFNGILTGQCHEISLNSNQFCNLTTVNQTGITNKKDFLARIKAATLLGTLQAAYTDFPYLRSSWTSITEQEALLGVSFTGIADAHGVVSKEWLEEGAKYALAINEKYAKKIGINPAARIGAVKPEGTCSTVVGSSSGIHERHSNGYYLRRIRINKQEALAGYLSAVIPDLVEQDVTSADTIVVTIPQESPKGSIGREDSSALKLFNNAIMYNQHWIQPSHQSGENTHNVSVTLSVREEEWEPLKKAMWKYRDKYSGISLLPFDGGSYRQMPFETCDEETFNKYDKMVKSIDLKQIREEQDNTNRMEILACVGGMCEIK